MQEDLKEYNVAVGETVKNDRKSKDLPSYQVMTWSKPKPESVKEFKVPGVFWKADERDESSKDKTPIFVYYSKEGEKGGDEKKYQAASVKKVDAELKHAASVKKSTKTQTECIIIMDASNNIRIERLQASTLNLNQICSQVPESRPEAPDKKQKRKYEALRGELGIHDPSTISSGWSSSSDEEQSSDDEESGNQEHSRGARNGGGKGLMGGGGKGLMAPSTTASSTTAQEAGGKGGGKGLMGGGGGGGGKGAMGSGGGKGLMGAGGKGLLQRPPTEQTNEASSESASHASSDCSDSDSE